MSRVHRTGRDTTGGRHYCVSTAVSSGYTCTGCTLYTVRRIHTVNTVRCMLTVYSTVHTAHCALLRCEDSAKLVDLAATLYQALNGLHAG